MKEAILLLMAIGAFVCILLCALFAYQIFCEVQSVRFYLEKKYLGCPADSEDDAEFPGDEK